MQLVFYRTIDSSEYLGVHEPGGDQRGGDIVLAQPHVVQLGSERPRGYL